MEIQNQSKRKLIWINILFFSFTTLISLIGAPLYIYHFGLSLSEVLLFIFYTVATGLSITMGYHRLFAHRNYQTHPLITFLLLFFGAAAFEESALTWASQHRNHHQHVDTDKDPYSIKKGFWYAHMGWFLFWEHDINYQNVKDLRKNRLIMHQNQHYHFWVLIAGIVTPLLLGALSGHLIGAFLISVCLRQTLVSQTTFCINSFCHTFGKATFDIHASARDHWLMALVIYGEGYHNFHHRFPTDYRNGIHWYQWDPTKWTIAILKKLGLAWNLKRVSNFRILEAQLAAEELRVRDSFQQIGNSLVLTKALDALKSRHLQLKQNLMSWESSVKEHQEIFHNRLVHHSQEVREVTLKRIKQAQDLFKKNRLQWIHLISHPPLDLLAIV